MLIVRKEQMSALEAYVLKGFEHELAEHVKRFVTKHAEAIGDDGVRQVVQLGIQRARSHGFTNRGPVRFYVEMMCMFGSDFDTDPSIPWAQGILSNDSIPTQKAKSDFLFERMKEYHEKVSGAEKQYYLNALENINKGRLEAYFFTPGMFADDMVNVLRNIYPQKFESLGRSGFDALVAKGKSIAEQHNVTSETGLARFIVLAFIIGHGFASDPFYPWISKTLAEEMRDPNEKAERVFSKMRLYLSSALEQRN